MDKLKSTGIKGFWARHLISIDILTFLQGSSFAFCCMSKQVENFRLQVCNKQSKILNEKLGKQDVCEVKSYCLSYKLEGHTGTVPKMSLKQCYGWNMKIRRSTNLGISKGTHNTVSFIWTTFVRKFTIRTDILNTYGYSLFRKLCPNIIPNVPRDSNKLRLTVMWNVPFDR